MESFAKCQTDEFVFYLKGNREPMKLLEQRSDEVRPMAEKKQARSSLRVQRKEIPSTNAICYVLSVSLKVTETILSKIKRTIEKLGD